MWGGGTVPPSTMNAKEFYMPLFDPVYIILTSILNATFLAQTISEINRKY